ncbi:MAG: BrnT family toxin [Patescibacteria group bacterium]|nr:BrnT family toxin [Patescibacteria group bacterium]
MQNIIDLPEPLQFEWDEHNSNKVRLRHNIMPVEAEQPFLSDYAVLFDDRHSIGEKRYQLVGPNNKGQILFIVFTIRNNKVRIISARSANRKERSNYGKKA